MEQDSNNEAQFTPGPWTAEDESLNAIAIRTTSKSAHKLGQEIASVMNEEGFDLTPAMWADARLIAAAPALYAALKEILNYGVEFEHADYVCAQIDKEAIKDARAALALASGGK